MNSLTLNIPPLAQLSDEQFYQICQANQELKFERTAIGELIIMPPTGGETGNLNSEINADFVFWNRQTQLGKVFDSSTCFRLPNGADRSPDVAWVRIDRWDSLTSEQKRRFPPIAPDFVLELLSPTDNWETAQRKMREYQDNQVRLGWLIDPQNRRVEIYRFNQPPQLLNSPTELTGEEVLPGLILNLQPLWQES